MVSNNGTVNPKCDPSQSPSNPAPDFDNNAKPLCGVQLAPPANISSCCSGPVQVANDCFQYCPPASTLPFQFGNCISRVANGTPSSGGVLTVCNKAASGGNLPPNAASVLGTAGALWWLMLAVLLRRILA